MLEFPRKTLIALTTVVVFGTAYSVVYKTYLDTSNPLLTNLPHPLHKTHYFATKANFLNVLFIKRLWAWTSAAFLALYLTSPMSLQTRERLYKYFAETAMWLLFTGWFFGPSLLDRVTASTGGECIAHLPSGAYITVPSELCYRKSTISLSTHPELFQTSLTPPEDSWHDVPRLRRGHDVSGHLFLLTMSVLFLTEQVSYSFRRLQATGGRPDTAWSQPHKWAIVATLAIITLEFFATYTTSVYFHTPFEKFTGFCESIISSLRTTLINLIIVLGVAGYAVTRTAAFRAVLPVEARPVES
jgi:hypothetical protein